MFRDWDCPETVFQLLKQLTVGQPCDISGIADYKMLDRHGGIQWPFSQQMALAAADDYDAERRLFEDGHFHHPDGRARFICEEPHAWPEQPNQRFPFVLLTGRGTLLSGILKHALANLPCCDAFVKIGVSIQPLDAGMRSDHRATTPGPAGPPPGRTPERRHLPAW